MCHTRWVEQHEASEVLMDPFMPITCCLEVGIVRPAQSFFLTIFRFSFIVALVLTEKVYLTSKGFQSSSKVVMFRYVDVIHAHENIENVKSTLGKLRSDAENFHRKAYGEALLLYAKV